MKSIDSHIQPKYFLKGFLATKKEANHNDSLFVYKKGLPFKVDGTGRENNPSKSGIGNTAFVRNFYAFLNDDGTIDTESYEIKLQREIEKPADDVLNKLRTIKLKKGEVIKVSDFLSNDERRKFTRYVGGMYARTKKNREKFNTIAQKAPEDTNKQGFSYADIASKIPPNEKKKLERYFRSVNPAFDESTDRFSVAPKYLEEFSDKIQKNESFPKSIFRAIDLLEPIILNMKWQIRITSALNKLFTGDAPVYYTNLREPNAELLFPISSNVIFCASNNQNLSETIFLERDDKFIVKIREIFAENCEELYFSREAKWLVDFFNKR